MTASIGQPAPDFTLINSEGEPVSLSDFRGKKTAIIFIPFPFSGMCTGELCDVRDNLSKFNDLDSNVVVITCHPRFTNAAWAERDGYQFPILADYWPHGETAIAYGCFNDKVGVAMRTTYILDEDGIVTDIIASGSLATARDIEDYPKALSR